MIKPLKLMEGNLHCTGKVAGFRHHIGIVKEHYIKDLTRNNNSKYPVVNKEKFHTLCKSFHSFNEVQTLPLQCPPQFHLGSPQDQSAK